MFQKKCEMILPKRLCIVRESNPGRPRGRRAFYHWTNDAKMESRANFNEFIVKSLTFEIFISFYLRNISNFLLISLNVWIFPWSINCLANAFIHEIHFYLGGLTGHFQEGFWPFFFLYKGENAIFEYFWPQGGTYPLYYLHDPA